MIDFLLSIAEKVLDWLISLRIKPKIKIMKISITDTLHSDKKRVHFTAIISNNSNKNMSISEKYLCFYHDKKQIHKIPVTKYDIVKKRDGFDELNILTPIDEIISLNAGESRKVSIIDEKENLNIADKIIFTYYTGRRTYCLKLKVNN